MKTTRPSLPGHGLLFLSAFALIACEPADEEVELTIDHYLVACQGLSPSFCERHRQAGADQFVLSYDHVIGLDYEWGYVFDVRVSITQVEEPLQDASSQRVELVQVLAKERVAEGTTFTMRLEPGFLEPSGAGFILIGLREVACASQVVCDDITAANSAGEFFNVTFEHGATSDDPMVALSVESAMP